MKKIYIKYNLWEDYKEGMYSLKKLVNKNELIKLNINLLSNPDLFYNTGIKLIDIWPNSCDENLSNKNINRLAWIGQASCFVNHKSPEYITKKSWKLLDVKTQNKANMVAYKILKHYEKRYNKVHRKMGETMLF